MEDVMDSAVGPHFSGLRLDSRRLSSSSLPSPTSANGNGNGTADAVKGLASPRADGTEQPFVIGTRNRLAAAAPRRLVYLSLVLGIFRLPWCGFEFWFVGGCFWLVVLKACREGRRRGRRRCAT